MRSNDDHNCNKFTMLDNFKKYDEEIKTRCQVYDTYLKCLQD